MWRLFTTALDRCAIRAACGSVRESPDSRHHLEEAAAFLSQPNFFKPVAETPKLEFTAGSQFQFRSPVASSSAENNLVRGRLERVKTDWQKHPAVLLLHGWNAELQYRWLFPMLAQRLNNAGINAVMFELPYHGSRRPTEPDTIRNFLSGNLLHVVQAVHQALADATALRQWLRAEGCPVVGVWGISLGGWLAGLLTAHDPSITFAVLMTPIVRMDRALNELAFCDPIRRGLGEMNAHFPALDLISHSPLCPPGHVLAVASKHDLFAPPKTIDELEHAWRAEVWRYSHGHISILLSSRIPARVVRWIGARVTS